jgi:SAM-dependent methyltransferase
MDLGTGDGRAVLARATDHPETLVIGVDASATAMADASRRAQRFRLSNAVFVAADALSLPDALAGFANALTITLPWGSLLHAAVGADPRLTRLLSPGGRLRLLLSASAGDGAAGYTELDPDRLAAAYRAAGHVRVSVEPANIDDIRAASSSWGKRLLQGGRGGRDRRLWLLEARTLSRAPDRAPPIRMPAPRRAVTGQATRGRRA